MILGGRRARLVASGIATAALLGPLGWLWYASLMPGTYSVTAMGHADHGTGAEDVPAAHGGSHGTSSASRDVSSLVADPDRPADVRTTLVAREGRFRLPLGREVEGYTFNGGSPGPQIRAVVGQLVEVRLVNESVRDGVSVHWHGVAVPNAMDGVAGVTQDAVGVGAEFTYRFVADRAGTFWYHAHQASREQVAGGLFGALIITPAPAPSPADHAVIGDHAQIGDHARFRGGLDVVALVHLYDGVRTVNGHEGDLRVTAAPGRMVRVRVINTENGLMAGWVAGAPFRLLAIDGVDVNGPVPVRDRAVLVTAGGRADLEVVMPPDGAPVRVQLGGSRGVVLGSSSFGPPAIARPAATVDPLTYGTPAAPAFDPAAADRSFRYDIGRRPGFLDGRPGLWWTVNGRMFPDLPSFVVAAGDVVRMRISNGSGDAHPMHLHGHHALVVSRDGVPASGSPWWVDSLEVGEGETYEIAFVADNPGIWTDHCHNLPHAAEGLLVHLMYEGITTGFQIGGRAGNAPE